MKSLQGMKKRLYFYYYYNPGPCVCVSMSISISIKSVFYKNILAKMVHTEIHNFGPIDSLFSNDCSSLIFQSILKIFDILKANTNPQL